MSIFDKSRNWDEITEAGVSNRIRKGWFKVIITDAEDKDTKAGDSVPEFTFRVVDGEDKGRETPHRFNIENKNELTVRIAFGQIKAIMNSIGMLKDGKIIANGYADILNKQFWLNADANKEGFIEPKAFKPLDFKPPYEGAHPMQPPPPAARNNDGAPSASGSANAGKPTSYAETDDDIPF
jgi:hypothetical protein